MRKNRKSLHMFSIVMALALLLSVGNVTAFAKTSAEDDAITEFDNWLGNAKVKSAGKISFGSNSSGNNSGSSSSAAPASEAAMNNPSADDLKKYALEVFELVNKEREAAGLEKVIWDDGFALCAQIRAEELQHRYSHYRPVAPTENRFNWPALGNGSNGVYNCPSVADEQGVDYTWVWENIVVQRKTPSAAMSAWMDSTGHRNNILKESHTRCGVGVYYTQEKGPSGYNWYWVLWFDK